MNKPRKSNGQHREGLPPGAIKVELGRELADAMRQPVDPYQLLGQKTAELAQKDRALGMAIIELGKARDMIAAYEKKFGPLASPEEAAAEAGSRG